MVVKIFTRPTCPKCPPAKTLAEKLKKQWIKVKMFNLDEVEGLTEGTLYGVMGTPTILIVDDKDKEIVSWRGQTPTEAEIKKYL